MMKKLLSVFAAVIVITVVVLAAYSNSATAQKAGTNCQGAANFTRCVHFNNDADGMGTGVQSRDRAVGVCEIRLEDGDFPGNPIFDPIRGEPITNFGDCVSLLRDFFLTPD